MRFLSVSIVLLVCSLSFGQQAGTFKSLKIIPTALPATCQPGAIRVNSGGDVLSICQTANTWSAPLTTQSTLTYSGGDILYSTANSLAFLPAGSSGQALHSGGTGSPTWAGGDVIMGGGFTFTTASGSYVDVNGAVAAITTTGGPVFVNYGGCSDGNFSHVLFTTPGTASASLGVLRNGSIIQQWSYQNNNTIEYPLSNGFVDVGVYNSPGTYTYKVQVSISGATSIQIVHGCITLWELK